MSVPDTINLFYALQLEYCLLHRCSSQIALILNNAGVLSEASTMFLNDPWVSIVAIMEWRHLQVILKAYSLSPYSLSLQYLC